MTVTKTIGHTLLGHNPWAWVQKQAHDDLTLFALRTVIILWAIFIIILVLTIKNKWVLGGILAYEVLP